MADIDVSTTSEGDGWTFSVTVSEGQSRTEHSVRLDPKDYERLTGGRCSAEELARSSFEFLLERESKESILKEFDLSVIGRYFPEYEAEIDRRISR